MARVDTHSLTRIGLAGFLAWIVPGTGHLYLGERRRGLIFLIVIGVTFWSGVALGGVGRTLDPQHRTAWFMAQISTGSHALAALGWKASLGDADLGYCWRAEEVAVVYAGVAGLLNLLVILDALARADLAPERRRVGRVDLPRGGGT